MPATQSPSQYQSGQVPVNSVAGLPFVSPSSVADVSTIAGGRPPRSRKNRPCDRCRRSKSRCAIGPSGPPCKPCDDGGKQCTFDYAPPPRPARADTRENTVSSALDDRLGSPSSGRAASVLSPHVAKRRRIDGGEGRTESYRTGRMHTAVSDSRTTTVPSFDHLVSSRFDPHGKLPNPNRRKS
jgi:hypothetical protein